MDQLGPTFWSMIFLEFIGVFFYFFILDQWTNLFRNTPKKIKDKNKSIPKKFIESYPRSTWSTGPDFETGENRVGSSSFIFWAGPALGPGWSNIALSSAFSSSVIV